MSSAVPAVSELPGSSRQTGLPWAGDAPWLSTVFRVPCDQFWVDAVGLHVFRTTPVPFVVPPALVSRHSPLIVMCPVPPGPGAVQFSAALYWHGWMSTDWPTVMLAPGSSAHSGGAGPVDAVVPPSSMNRPDGIGPNHAAVVGGPAAKMAFSPWNSPPSRATS